jgi:hypothetical protein
LLMSAAFSGAKAAPAELEAFAVTFAPGWTTQLVSRLVEGARKPTPDGSV